ncbi:hypothetical protein JAAARDRAFT_39427 [Jaapia argillacea MUCL 33604]|uniref:Uncharacterized protein n=1 Tax=Jaapia argillacea MUCL 33604 TaxID=933084 RepID=A0A067PF00_9AGAM|nr:hypothetical protein JAAARDRAFT_39427 [Jaapia argillacea MUCL 33604]
MDESGCCGLGENRWRYYLCGEELEGVGKNIATYRSGTMKFRISVPNISEAERRERRRLVGVA